MPNVRGICRVGNNPFPLDLISHGLRLQIANARPRKFRPVNQSAAITASAQRVRQEERQWVFVSRSMILRSQAPTLAPGEIVGHKSNCGNVKSASPAALPRPPARARNPAPPTGVGYEPVAYVRG